MANSVVTKSMAGVAVISCLLLLTQHISMVSATDEFEIVIATGKNLGGTVSGISLALQTETAGTVVSLETEGMSIASRKLSTFKVSTLGIGPDVCFMQLLFTQGSAKEWSVESVSVRSLTSKGSKKVTFAVNQTVKINGVVTVDNCKVRQES